MNASFSFTPEPFAEISDSESQDFEDEYRRPGGFRPSAGRGFGAARWPSRGVAPARARSVRPTFHPAARPIRWSRAGWPAQPVYMGYSPPVETYTNDAERV